MDQHDLADRLIRLERDDRRLKRIGAVVLLGIVAVVVMGQAKTGQVADVLKAKKFEVIDGTGSSRAMLSCANESGSPSLVLRDQNGMIKVMLTVSDEGRGAVECSGDISVKSGSISIWDHLGQLSALLQSNQAPRGISLAFYGKGGDPLGGITAVFEGELFFHVTGESGAARLEAGGLSFFDKDRKVIFKAPK